VQAKDEAQAGDLDVTLATLVEGLRIITVVLVPWMTQTTAKLRAALGVEQTTLACAVPGGDRVVHVEKIEPLFPKEQAPR
jgi:methionyl-tRNA synthetase